MDTTEQGRGKRQVESSYYGGGFAVFLVIVLIVLALIFGL